jgi:hypothetical protein
LTDVGEEVVIVGGKCRVIACSDMGVTIFDLFGEIMDQNDIRSFLEDNSIECATYSYGALVARLVIFLIDITKKDKNFKHSEATSEIISWGEPPEILNLKILEENETDDRLENSFEKVQNEAKNTKNENIWVIVPDPIVQNGNKIYQCYINECWFRSKSRQTIRKHLRKHRLKGDPVKVKSNKLA